MDVSAVRYDHPSSKAKASTGRGNAWDGRAKAKTGQAKARTGRQKARTGQTTTTRTQVAARATVTCRGHSMETAARAESGGHKQRDCYAGVHSLDTGDESGNWNDSWDEQAHRVRTRAEKPRCSECPELAADPSTPIQAHGSNIRDPTFIFSVDGHDHYVPCTAHGSTFGSIDTGAVRSVCVWTATLPRFPTRVLWSQESNQCCRWPGNCDTTATSKSD